MDVRCKMIGKLGELVEPGSRFEGFDQYMWTVPLIVKVFAWKKRPNSWWWVVVDFLLEVA